MGNNLNVHRGEAFRNTEDVLPKSQARPENGMTETVSRKEDEGISPKNPDFDEIDKIETVVGEITPGETKIEIGTLDFPKDSNSGRMGDGDAKPTAALISVSPRPGRPRDNFPESPRSIQFTAVKKFNADASGMRGVARVELGHAGATSFFEALKIALAGNDAFISATFRDDLVVRTNFLFADLISIDYDYRNHAQENDDSLSNHDKVKELVSSLLPKEVPQPNFAYLTAHGIRMIWLLKERVSEVAKYESLACRLAVEVDGDFQCTGCTKPFLSACHVKRFGLHQISSAPLDAELLLNSQLFAVRNFAEADNSLFREACIKLGLNLECNSPSRLSPRGDHDNSTDSNLKVYADHLYDFSRGIYIQAAEVIASAGLMPPPAKDPYKILRDLVWRFVGRQEVEGIVATALRQRGWQQKRAEIGAEVMFAQHIAEISESEHSHGLWRLRLEGIFVGRYPDKHRVYIDGSGAPAVVKVAPEMLNEGYAATSTFDLLHPLQSIGAALLARISPAHHAVVKNNESNTIRVLPTAQVNLFKACERSAVEQAALTRRITVNRPILGLPSGWRNVTGTLPTFVAVPTLTCSANVPPKLLEDFFGDLRKTFAFADDDSFAAYIAFLVQPMIAHLKRGLLPGYLINGPTKSGKNALVVCGPKILYTTNNGSPIMLLRQPSDREESAKMYADAAHSIYLLLDEAVDASLSMWKDIDSLITSEEIQTRVLHVGYRRQPNHFVVALTAISSALSDESSGRLVEIRLRESRPAQIDDFIRKWKPRGPLLLKAFYNRLSTIDVEAESPPIPDRRPGFSLLARILNEAFCISTTFPARYGVNDVLEVLAALYEDPNCGDMPSIWKRVGIQIFSEKLRARLNKKLSKQECENHLVTGLGFGSTENHPQYVTGGYVAENDHRYHMKISEEGKRRIRIFVRAVQESELTSPPTIVLPSVEPVAPSNSSTQPAVVDAAQPAPAENWNICPADSNSQLEGGAH